jgi:DNA-binding transcriptional ArsR family regulator
VDERLERAGFSVMQEAIDVATLAALIGEPARARMLTALMGGIALTATELAAEAEVATSTASLHLAKLVDARVLAVEKQGRHRYFRLADDELAEMLESLIGFAARRVPPVRTGPPDPDLRAARVCYDHLAGERGVWLFDRMRERGLLTGRDTHELSPRGREQLSLLGIDVDALTRSRRPLCRSCLDWSERRHHLGGSVGAALLRRIFALRWARQEPSSRIVTFTAEGDRALRRHFDR